MEFSIQWMTSAFLNQQCPMFPLPLIRFCVVHSSDMWSPDVSSCIALFTLVQTGLGRYQTGSCVSVMFLPLVRLILVFRLLISTCSITWHADNPAQNWLLLLTTCTPWVNCLWTLGYVSSSLVIYFRYMYWDSIKWQYAVRHVSISCGVPWWRDHSPILSDLIIALTMLTISMYSIHNLAVSYFNWNVLGSCQLSFIGAGPVTIRFNFLYRSFTRNEHFHRSPLSFPVPREHCHLTNTTLF